MFDVGDLIIYSGEGVCRVEAVGAPPVSGADSRRLYYTLAPLNRTGRVFTPVDSSVFMRPVISREEAIDLIRQIPVIHAEIYESRNLRFLTEHYQETLQSHKCTDLVKLIKDVYLKRKHAAEHGKKLGQIDERFMRRAEDMLYGELSVALDIPKENMSDYIACAIEKMEAGEEFAG